MPQAAVSEPTESTLEVELLLEIEDYEDFIEHEAEIFLSELALSVNCAREDILNAEFRQGCVIAKLRLPEPIALRLLELFAESKGDGARDELGLLRELISKYSIEEIQRLQKFEVVMTVKSRPKEKAVLFVHGWSGAKTSFGTMPELVGKACNCSTHVFTYPSGVWSHSPSIVYIANALRNYVLNLIPDKRLAIVAHSMGGLVARQLLVTEARSESRIDLNVENIVFLASPHGGSVYANIAKQVPTINSQQLGDLDTNSPVLFQLNLDWTSWARDRINDCHIGSVFGTADGVVSSNNSIGLSREVATILGRTHTNITVPESPEDEVLLTVLRFLSKSEFVVADVEGNLKPAPREGA